MVRMDIGADALHPGHFFFGKRAQLKRSQGFPHFPTFFGPAMQTSTMGWDMTKR